MVKSISIADVPMQKTRNPEVIANWILESLGVITREKHGDDYTSLLLLLLEKTRESGDSVSVQEIQKRIGIKRSTAYKYIGRLMNAGIAKKIGMNQYMLADGKLAQVVQDLKRNAIGILEKIKERAELLDEEISFI